MIIIIICLSVVFLYCGLLIFYRISWGKIKSPEEKQFSGVLPVVSILIPARNEAENIADLLSSLLAQSYPSHLLDIILIDDHSTDATAEIASRFTNVRVVRLSDHVEFKINSYKKKAIDTGISLAKGSLILCTDADCIAGEKWVSSMVAFHRNTGASFIAAPVAINFSFNFLEMFQTLDFMTLQGITASAVSSRTHNMCNGANLMYTKEAFIKVNGFEGIDNIASGDDMLLMQKISEVDANGIGYTLNKDAIITTAPAKTIKEFFNQRIRWASKSASYRDKSLLPVLLIVYFTNVAFLILPLIAFFNPYVHFNNYDLSIIVFWLGLWIIKIIFELIFLFPVAGFYNKKKLLWLFPLFQPFHIIYTIVAGFLGMKGSYNWKGREVK